MTPRPVKGTRVREGACQLLAAALFGALSACGGASEPGGDPDRPRDILLITIDTLRADHLGIYGYERDTSPQIDRWFEQGAIYERSYSTEASTSPSVASLLTGKLPQDHGVRLFFQVLPEGTELVPDLLPPEYQKVAVVSNMVLTDEAMGMAKHFDHYDDLVDQKESAREMYERDARGTTDAALRWIGLEQDPDRPLFLWVHYIDPHGPYAPPEDWPVRFTHEGEKPIDVNRIHKYGRLPGVTDGLTYVDRYDAEISYVDAEVDRLLRGFGQFNDVENALIVLTSDHGESMMEHERWFGHTYHVYEEITRVPLLLRGPGVVPGRFEGLASGIDVAPTLLRFAGVEPPAAWEGIDLLDGSIGREGRLVFTEASRKNHQWRAALEGDQKWIAQVRGEGREIARRVHFRLDQDPGELSAGPWPEGTPGSARLLERIASDPDPAGIPSEYRSGIRLTAPKVAPNLNEAQLEKLKHLGYAE